MFDIIDLTVNSMNRMGFEIEHVEDELIFFNYKGWPGLCEKCNPFLIKIMVYFYSSNEDFSWESDQFRLEICECASNYKMSNEEYFHETEGTLFLVMNIVSTYEENAEEQVYSQLIYFFNESIPHAKEYIKNVPDLRDALGQYTHWGWKTPQESISEMDCWTDVRQYTEGLVAVADHMGRYGFLDADAEEAIPCKWAYAQPFSEGLAAVENVDGRYGFINRKGNIAIPCEWHRAEWFSEGLAAVMSANGEWGFIDTNARLIIPCEWNEVDEFHNGRAQVWDNEGYSYFINRQGNIIEYTSVFPEVF